MTVLLKLDTGFQPYLLEARDVLIGVDDAFKQTYHGVMCVYGKATMRMVCTYDYVDDYVDEVLWLRQPLAPRPTDPARAAMAENMHHTLWTKVEQCDPVWLAGLAQVHSSLRAVVDGLRGQLGPLPAPRREEVCSSVELLEFACGQGLPLDQRTSAAAAGSGHLDALIWLHERNCPLDWGLVCDAAAAGGQRHVLEWLRQQQHIWSIIQIHGSTDLYAVAAGLYAATWSC